VSSYIQVCTTTASVENAHQLAAALVEQRLAACVQIDGPVQSVYRWQGNVEQAEEWRLSIKTSNELFSKVDAAIRDLHRYECPEVVATPIVAGSDAYLAWLGEQLEG
jgi:periplasmic divalent cation tolerance protein